MKIIHVINGLGNGGAEKNLIRYTLYDKKNNHQIIILRKINFYRKLLKSSKIRCYYFDLSFSMNLYDDIKKIFFIIKREKPEILMCWMYHACFLGSFLNLFEKKIKLIWNIRHSNFIFGKSKLKTILLARIIMPFFQLIPKSIIFNSQHSLNIHKKYFLFNKKKLIIRNGFELPKVNIKKTKKKKFSILKIGFIGRYSPQKNYEFFFRFLNELKKLNVSFKSYLIGSNINKKNLELIYLIRYYNLTKNVIFLKQKNNIDEYYQMFDVLISTSVYGESFSNVLAESMINKTICLAPNIGENSYIINDKKLIYKPNNLEDLIKKFSKLFYGNNKKKIIY